ncbi:hypothetical protein RJ639_033827 [Escallonia herrerae]|uniref:ADF-H domain-containing protein n=1 Tax=Escallonia herrerae TaxID=1293975 RepID=A0AA88WUU6_9ASTE|nr:hypothetical protein RJ639_033827 [Escallonia herrerae]
MVIFVMGIFGYHKRFYGQANSSSGMAVNDECKLKFLEPKAKSSSNKCALLVDRSPDTSRVRSKMLYASTKDRIKRELDGIQVELQATDPSEMSIDIDKSRAL